MHVLASIIYVHFMSVIVSEKEFAIIKTVMFGMIIMTALFFCLACLVASI